MGRTSRRAGEKLIALPRLIRVIAEERARGRRVVLTNGCFDLLHAGHLKLLESAAGLGDLLVVAINRDDSVRLLKGPARPVLPFEQRALLVAGLEVVDWVVGFDEATPLELIQAIRPSVLVKGGDWPAERMVGGEFVKSLGGRVVSLPLLHGHSTSRLVDRIRGGKRLKPATRAPDPKAWPPS